MQEPEIPIDELFRISTLRELKILDTPREERFDRLAGIASRLFDVPIVLVSLVDRDRQWFKSSIGFEPSESSRSTSFCGHTILNDSVLIVNDTLLDPRFDDNPLVIGDPGVRFYAGTPITAINDQRVGTFCILDYQPRQLDSEEIQLLLDIAELVEKEVNIPDLKILNEKLLQSEAELLKTIEETVENEKRQRSRNKSLELISRGYPLHEVLKSIASEIEQHSPEMFAAIMVLDRGSQKLRPGATPSLPPSFIEAISDITVADGNGSCGTAACTGKRVVVENIQTHPYWKDWKTQAEAAGLAASWAQPVKNASGEVLGTLSIYHRKIGAPELEEIHYVESIANLISIALERDHEDRQMWHQANYDSLTGLPNRNLLRERLEQELIKCQRNWQPLALLFIDLDHFKQVNDRFGHDKGDEILSQVASRLSACVRQIDTVARLGGDEFTIVMTDLTARESVVRVAEKVLSKLAREFSFDQESVSLSASLGIAFYPDHGEDMDALIKSADRAMYESKNAGRNRYSISSDESKTD